MQNDLLSILLSFIEGFALLLSPCILPILPIVLSSSLIGESKRPIGIILGFAFNFAAFALLSRTIVQYSDIDLNSIRYLSYILLLLLGVLLCSNHLTEVFARFTQKLANVRLPYQNSSSKGFISGFCLGGLIAIVWTPCAGPILATIIVQIATQKSNFLSFIMLLAFALGAAIPMFVIALYGRALTKAFHFFRAQATSFRKILGIVIITNVAYLLYQERDFVGAAIPETTIRPSFALEDGLWMPYKAPEITGISSWINSPPLQPTSLKGKVVLVDFWAYSCINCVRTLPYLNYWYHKYHSKGLVVIGVHTPEFAFEKNPNNVQNAIIRYGIHYPVALDNHFITWRNFSNRYWPAHYLISKTGDVVYEHFGEGDYEVTENNIRFLLGIHTIDKPNKLPTPSFNFTETRETYLGFERADKRLSPPLLPNTVANYHFDNSSPTNGWRLQGLWQVFADKIVSKAPLAALKIKFNARKVFMVMGSSTNKPIRVKILLNGKPLSTSQGDDVLQSSVLVNAHNLYAIVSQEQVATGILEVVARDAGLEVYTFTFGH